ncbi:transposase [Candidatus Rhabdochlamydia porcellionis]|uniref:transposase n=1 Tax=Candidatus Rhabdochlamydia porcellionis TaxID=225148 RepID=UPI00331303A3
MIEIGRKGLVFGLISLPAFIIWSYVNGFRKRSIKRARCEVLFLPPYSPDLNPIEKFWAHFKKRVKEALT